MTVVDEPLAIPEGFGHDPFLEIWNRLSRPFDVVSTMSALIGSADPTSVGQMIGAEVATSLPEAEALLDAMPKADPVPGDIKRCRPRPSAAWAASCGPVLWSETMSARASSFGDEGLFVCKTPSRAYDIDENRVLVRPRWWRSATRP